MEFADFINSKYLEDWLCKHLIEELRWEMHNYKDQNIYWGIWGKLLKKDKETKDCKCK